MVIFNELRVTRDGNYLVIDVRVRKEHAYRQVFLKSITIGSGSEYEEGKSNGHVINIDNPSITKEYSARISNLEIPSIDFKKDLIFVYVETEADDPADLACLPCDMTVNPTIGVTMYMGDIYASFMNSIKEIGNNDCQVPSDFTDKFLQYKAITLAMDSGHYLQGIDYYDKWVKNIRKDVVSNGCGCHG